MEHIAAYLPDDLFKIFIVIDHQCLHCTFASASLTTLACLFRWKHIFTWLMEQRCHSWRKMNKTLVFSWSRCYQAGLFMRTDRTICRYTRVKTVKEQISNSLELDTMMDSDLNTSYPPNTALHLTEHAIRCLKPRSKSRLTMREIGDTLRQIMQILLGQEISEVETGHILGHTWWK